MSTEDSSFWAGPAYPNGDPHVNELIRLQQDNARLAAEAEEAGTLCDAAILRYLRAEQERDSLSDAVLDLQREKVKLDRHRVAEKARADSMREALEKAHAVAYAAPELNMGNYSDDQVRNLNDSMCEVFTLLDAALSAQPSAHGQSPELNATPQPEASAPSGVEMLRAEFRKLCDTLEPRNWTVSESATYFGFFCHGWHAAQPAPRELTPQRHEQGEGKA